MKKQAIKVLENQKGATPKTTIKVNLFIIKKTTYFPPKSYNPGVQNIYYSAECMIVSVLHSIPVLGATCACQDLSSNDIWTLKCRKCGADHLDHGVLARKAHTKHVFTCSTMWVG